MTGTLYIIATPIGNLQDITLRAIETLKNIDILYAEDKRITANLLNHFEIKVPELRIYNQHSSDSIKNKIGEELLFGQNIGLVTDAGTPGISDPGNELIDYLTVKVQPLKVVPVPGVSALTAALSVSGMNVSKFTFIGFLPKKKRQKLFNQLKDSKLPFVFYESPNRVIKSLGAIRDYFGNVEVFVARELTKMHETVYKGEIERVLLEIETAGKIKGEIVVLVNPLELITSLKVRGMSD